MSVKKELFGQTKSGEPICIYTIDNGTISARVIDYGANLVNLMVPDRNGTMQDIILGFDDAEGYFDNGCFFGALVGPIANRIGDASYEIDGQAWKLAVNDGPNNLHSDKDAGFHKRMWKALAGEDFVTFTLELEDGELGMPGNRNFSVTYSVTDLNALSIHYHATSDRRTIINPTNHAYFNLNGHNSGSIAAQELQLNAHAITAVREGSIPTGELLPVEGTPFDFTVSKPIGRDIDADNAQLKIGGGFDHNWCLDGWSEDGGMFLAGTAYSPKSGRKMDIYTNLPGIQFYAGNMIECETGRGKEHSTYGYRCAFCLETQYYPDSIHWANFPDSVFGAGRVYDSTTQYRFTTVN